ncbi:MAG: co-chaperone GroES [Oceanospirillaceae bacterium]|nr:co-chaperone GroES [Oceanospirillaceae bacterium]
MSIKPLEDRVLVRRVDAQTLSAGGIVIPDKAAEKPTEGIVIAVGPGRRLENGQIVSPLVAEGDRVVFKKYGAQEITENGEKLLIIREADLLAVVEESVKEEEAA